MKNLLDLVSVVLLPALWAGSFVTQRVLAPAMGVFPMSFWRLVIAGLMLAAVLRFMRVPLNWREHWRAYLLSGLMTTGMPWCMVAFASIHLPAAYLSILSSTAPLWASLAGALMLGERITLPVAAGLTAGMAGIWVITGHDGAQVQSSAFFWLAIAGMTFANIATGLTAAWSKRISAKTQSHALACGTMLGAALILSPASMLPSPRPFDGTQLWQLLLLGIAFSAFASLLYFRLLSRVTTSKALATLYLNPVFTSLWGWLFLGEAVTERIVIGSILVLGGTSLITFSKSAPAEPK